MDIFPLNSPSLNTLLRSAGLKSDFQIQKNLDVPNLSASHSDKISSAATEKYEPGKSNFKQPEASFFSLIQPQFQSNTPITKKSDTKNTHFESSKPLRNNNTVSASKPNRSNYKTAKIYSSSTEIIGTGYFISAPIENSNILDLIPEQNRINSKFKIYFDQTEFKGKLINITL